eukprot:4376247-Pyramimonas_sp.AAC.2
MSHTVHAKKPITVPSTTCGYIPMTGQSDAGSVDAHISRIWPYDGEAAYRGTLTVRLTTTDYDVAKPSTRPMRLGGGLERVLLAAVVVVCGPAPGTGQSDAGSAGIFSRRTNQTQEIGHMRCGLP